MPKASELLGSQWKEEEIVFQALIARTLPDPVKVFFNSPASVQSKLSHLTKKLRRGLWSKNKTKTNQNNYLNDIQSCVNQINLYKDTRCNIENQYYLEKHVMYKMLINLAIPILVQNPQNCKHSKAYKATSVLLLGLPTDDSA